MMQYSLSNSAISISLAPSNLRASYPNWRVSTVKDLSNLLPARNVFTAAVLWPTPLLFTAEFTLCPDLFTMPCTFFLNESFGTSPKWPAPAGISPSRSGSNSEDALPNLVNFLGHRPVPASGANQRPSSLSPSSRHGHRRGQGHTSSFQKIRFPQLFGKAGAQSRIHPSSGTGTRALPVRGFPCVAGGGYSVER